MTMYDQGKQATAEGVGLAREAIRKGEAKAEQSLHAVQDGLFAASDNAREMNLKLIDIMRRNAEAFFEFAEQIAGAKDPSKLAEIWSTQTRKQMALFSQQGQELASLGQKLATKSVESVSNRVR
jgi:phasin